MLRATLYVPAGTDLWRWLPQMTDWATSRGLTVGSTVRHWRELAALLGGGEADIGVIPSWEHLRPDRLPRLMAMQDPPVAPSVPRPRPEVRWR